MILMKTTILSITIAALVALTSCQTAAPPEQSAKIPKTELVQTSAPIVKTTPTPLPPKPSASPAEQTIKPYPLDICLVTDEPLDEWDEMQRVVYQNQEMKFCCKMCLKKFNANPDKYLALLPQA